MIEHIKRLLLGLGVIILVLVCIFGIVWLFVNTPILYALEAIIVILVILVIAYAIGESIRESNEKKIQ